MALVWVLLGMLVLGGVAVVASGRGQGLPPADTDRPDLALPPDRPLVRADVDRVRFSVGLRGYRMDEVDDVLDRLALDLETRDLRIALLEQRASRLAVEPEPAAVGSAAIEPDEPTVAHEPTQAAETHETDEAAEAAEAVEAVEAAGEHGADDADEYEQVERTLIVPFAAGPRSEPAVDAAEDSPPGARGD